MIHIPELERQWLAYRRKKLIPKIYASIAVLLLAALVIVVSLWEPSPSQEAAVPVAETNDTVVQTPVETVTVIEPALPVAPQKPIDELKPSFDFLKQIKPTKYEPPVAPPKAYNPKQAVTTQAPLPQITERKPVASEHPSEVPSITTTASKEKIDTLIARFNVSKNPMLGIVIAQQYMEMQAYEKAYGYALEVNAIDQSNEASWLIAAKALYFLQKPEPAQQLLLTYLGRTNSVQAQKLLQNIRSGTLRP